MGNGRSASAQLAAHVYLTGGTSGLVSLARRRVDFNFSGRGCYRRGLGRHDVPTLRRGVSGDGRMAKCFSAVSEIAFASH